MPTTRVLYTIRDVRYLLAQVEKVPPESVDVFEGETLARTTDHHGEDLSDGDYLFQVDK